MRKINVLIHGASVTQQKFETSYFEQILKLDIHAGRFNFFRKAYGGCHFDDAGFLTLASDLNEFDSLDVCLLEWNTTGLSKFDPEKLKYVVGTLVNRKIVPIFLILAREDTVASSRECELQVLKFCQDFGVLCFDYRTLISPFSDLRDVVHTNLSGAVKYAQRLYTDLLNISECLYKCFGSEFLYKKYEIFSMRGVSLDVLEQKKLEIVFSEIGDLSQVVLEVVRGPSSPIILINGRNTFSVWDEWCHFERPGFITVSRNVKENLGLLEIRVLSDAIDYSKCRREFSFSGIKELKVRGVHGVNCKPENINVVSC